MLRFEACASFDLLHSEALHLRRPAVLCGQPKNCGQARQPPPPAPPQCGALSPKRLLVPSLPLYLLLFAQGSPPPSLRHAQRMQSALTKGWNRLGPFGAAKLPVNLTIQNTGASSPPPPPPFFMARALFPAPPFVLACISTAPSPNVIQVHAVRCNAGSPSPSYVSGWLSWGRSVPVPSTKNGEPWLKFRWVATHTPPPSPPQV